VSTLDEVLAVRRGAGLFRLGGRGLLRVEGGDRVRWLDGMVTNDVASLAPGPERSGCYAALLTRQGRIVADFHVLLRDTCLWLETAREAVATAMQTLERFIIADDVSLHDASAEVERLGLEGPAAGALLAAALGRELPLAEDACASIELAGVPVVVAAFGWSGAPARQLFAPAGAGERVAAALLAAGPPHGLVEAGAEALEVLRVEAGVPRLFAELGPDVLPAEARLVRAVSTTKGCYTGQEVVARMASRGRVGHLLVGLRLDVAEGDAARGREPGAGRAGSLPAAGAELRIGDSVVGELTSACLSPSEGAIALGFVRAARAEPGTRVSVGDREGRIAQLPFAAARGT
jgi:folate-binding protein YgfZ